WVLSATAIKIIARVEEFALPIQLEGPLFSLRNEEPKRPSLNKLVDQTLSKFGSCRCSASCSSGKAFRRSSAVHRTAAVCSTILRGTPLTPAQVLWRSCLLRSLPPFQRNAASRAASHRVCSGRQSCECPERKEISECGRSARFLACLFSTTNSRLTSC